MFYRLILPVSLYSSVNKGTLYLFHSLTTDTFRIRSEYDFSPLDTITSGQ